MYGAYYYRTAGGCADTTDGRNRWRRENATINIGFARRRWRGDSGRIQIGPASKRRASKNIRRLFFFFCFFPPSFSTACSPKKKTAYARRCAARSVAAKALQALALAEAAASLICGVAADESGWAAGVRRVCARQKASAPNVSAGRPRIEPTGFSAGRKSVQTRPVPFF